MTSFARTEAPDASGRIDAGLPHLALSGWMDRVPGLVAGITTGGADGDFDLGLRGAGATSEVLPRWERLRAATGAHATVHAPQLHGAAVRHTRDAAGGLALLDACDGHVTRTPGVLLTVSVADCVPVFLIDRVRGALALIHAGWRGAAAGILEVGAESLKDAFGTAPADLDLHLGPSICGECYEVGPEVFEALGEPAPPTNTPIDLPALLLRRAADLGIDPAASSRSTHCTKCGSVPLFSHRAGHAQRQVAFLGFTGAPS